MRKLFTLATAIMMAAAAWADEDVKEVKATGNIITSATGAIKDTEIRMNFTTGYGNNDIMEIRSDWTGTDTKTYNNDLVGLFQFTIPAYSNLSDYEVKRATLRLTTRLRKGATVFNIYSYGHDFDEQTTYATEANCGGNDYVALARKTTATTFTANSGSSTKPLDYDIVTSTFLPDIDKWTNCIDITDIVKAATGKFQLMIEASTSNTNAANFYTREAKGFTNYATSTTYTTDQLVPQLTIVYVKKNTTTIPVTISSAGCATLCLPVNATLPSALKAYNLTVSDGTVSKEEVTSISANSPVYIEGEAGDYNLTIDNAPVLPRSTTNGALTGVYNDTTATAGTYVLQLLNGKPAFYQVAAGSEPSITAYHAYMTVPEGSSTAKVLYFADDFTPTAISEVTTTTHHPTTTTQHPTTTTPLYNLAGQKVGSDAKGIIISGGKKFIK